MTRFFLTAPDASPSQTHIHVSVDGPSYNLRDQTRGYATRAEAEKAAASARDFYAAWPDLIFRIEVVECEPYNDGTGAAAPL